MIPVILSGGSGERLWPLSRKLFPKQFLNLYKTNESLLQSTISRLPEYSKNPIIVCNQEHRFIVAEQLREINCKTQGIILEPCKKNTAPAIALACFHAIELKTDEPLFILPSDHVINDLENFYNSIETAIKLANENKVVCFGVKPSRPDTQYGYIQIDIENISKPGAIKSFTEKPDFNKAEKYFYSEEYFWNSGMFMFKPSVYLNELKKFSLDIYESSRNAYKDSEIDFDFIRIDKHCFESCPEDSIDYAVMEKTNNGVAVPLDADWNDVGSWNSLWHEKPKDDNGNCISGKVKLDDVNDSLIHGTNKFILASGVDNLIVVDSPDALYISNKNKPHNLKKLVSEIKEIDMTLVEDNVKVYRPWGFFTSLLKENKFQVKILCIKPGEKISLQKHQHRSEHWVVVKGKAKITKGSKTFFLIENESTYIGQGVVHRLENNSDNELVIIEIQTGDYLGEDDIIRFDDIYQRG